jgi:hypothetical protein
MTHNIDSSCGNAPPLVNKVFIIKKSEVLSGILIPIS